MLAHVGHNVAVAFVVVVATDRRTLTRCSRAEAGLQAEPEGGA